MTEHAPDRFWSGIEISKVVAGTLAAVSAAVIGSFLGVAGTLAGAAIASIVGTVGTELYHRSLDRGAKKIQTLAPAFIKAPAAVGTPEVPAATVEDSPSHTVAEELKQETPAAASGRPKGGVRWGRVGLAAVALFILAMVPLTIVEMASGRTVSNLVGSSTATGTSVGAPFTGERKATETTPSDDSSPDEATTPATDGDGEQEGTPTTTDPTTEPTTGGPTTGAPATQEPPGAEEPTTPAGEPDNEQEQPDQQPDPQDQQGGQPERQEQEQAPEPGTE